MLLVLRYRLWTVRSGRDAVRALRAVSAATTEELWDAVALAYALLPPTERELARLHNLYGAHAHEGGAAAYATLTLHALARRALPALEEEGVACCSCARPDKNSRAFTHTDK